MVNILLPQEIGRLDELAGTPASEDMVPLLENASGNIYKVSVAELVGAGGGDVVGPASATAFSIPIYSDNTGKSLGTTSATYDEGTNSFTMTGALFLEGNLEGSGQISGTDVIVTGDFQTLTAAKTLVLKQGTNGKTGSFTLNGITPVTVNNTSVTLNSMIFFSLKTVGGTVGAIPVLSAPPTAGISFSVEGTAGDTSVYNYIIIESAA